MSDLLIGQLSSAGVGDGASRAPRGCRYGEAAVTQAHGRYQDAVDRGAVFHASLPAAVALGTALTATGVTFTLANPAGSGKNLVLLQATLAVVVGTTAGFVVYAVNNTPGQVAVVYGTPLAAGIHNAMLGAGDASIAKVCSACTLPAAPIVLRVMAGIISTTPGGVHSIVDDIGGAIVLPENTAITVQGITTNATGVISMMWEEVTP